MAPRSANVTSTKSIRAFRAAVQQFIDGAHNGLITLQLEANRGRDWIENDRTRYWPREEKKALDAVGEARVALARCEMTAPEGSARSCYDERRALEKAKRRVELAGEKIRAVKMWRQVIKKEVEEYLVQVTQLKDYLDSDLQKALTSLERMSDALQRYMQQPMVVDANTPQFELNLPELMSHEENSNDVLPAGDSTANADDVANHGHDKTIGNDPPPREVPE